MSIYLNYAIREEEKTSITGPITTETSKPSNLHTAVKKKRTFWKNMNAPVDILSVNWNGKRSFAYQMAAIVHARHFEKKNSKVRNVCRIPIICIRGLAIFISFIVSLIIFTVMTLMAAHSAQFIAPQFFSKFLFNSFLSKILFIFINFELEKLLARPHDIIRLKFKTIE